MLFSKRRTVFISGSAYEYGRFGSAGKPFIRNLTKVLIKNNFRIISGFGLGIGSAVVEGALDEVYQEKKANITEYLQIAQSNRALGLRRSCFDTLLLVRNLRSARLSL